MFRPLRIKAFRGVLVVAVVLLLVASNFLVAVDTDFVPIFDGKTLAGWKAPDMTYWSVEDGAITAQSTAEHPCKTNQFLVLQNDKPGDFELRLKFRIEGPAVSNSGVQFRSSVREDGHVVGYQADIDRAGQWLGSIYDEAKRGQLAKRGQKLAIDSAGRRTLTALGDAAKLLEEFKKDEWNEYRIVARGSHIILELNGKVMAEVEDNDVKQQALSGVIALQLHSGPPMRIQFKDIQIKRLPAEAGR